MSVFNSPFGNKNNLFDDKFPKLGGNLDINGFKLIGNGGVLTGSSTPYINLTQTWNNAATTFIGETSDITNTASASASLLREWKVGGVRQQAFHKNGGLLLKAGNGSVIGDLYYNGTNYTVLSTDASAIRFSVQTIEFHITGAITPGSSIAFSPKLTLSNSTGLGAASSTNATFPNFIVGQATGHIAFGSGAYSIGNPAPDLYLRRDAAGVLALRNGTNAQGFNIYNTYTNATNYELGFAKWVSNVFEIGTTQAGTGVARAIKLNGVNRSAFEANPSGGIVIDSQARTAINSILASIISHGLMAAS
jgi:hypothetical protein